MSTSIKTAPSEPVPTQYQSAGQTRAWTEPIPTTWNTTASAVCALSANSVGYYLIINNDFGFAISSDSTINGIVAEILCRGGGGTTYDSEVVIVKDGVLGGTNRSEAGAWNSGSFVYKSHGGATDLWGTTWTPAQINASDFGVAVSPKTIGDGADGEIQGVRITVYYTPSNIKTINGLARASVKTKNFLDIANIKTFNGLT
jgi:hypothetical protein